MADALAVDTGETLGADVVGHILLIPTHLIDRDDRLRPVDPVWAGALGQVMRREGQRTPIEVCRLPDADRWTLVAGGHRHAGAELADIAYLRAEVVSAGRDDRRLREVSENLWRRDLDPIDRAAFLAEAVAILKRRAGLDPTAHGNAISAAARWQKAVRDEAEDANVTMTNAYGFADAVAEQLGFSRSKVERDLMLYRRLAPSLVSRLRRARPEIARNATQLRALAKLDDGKQRRVIERLLDYPGTSFPEAMATVSGKIAADPETKRLNAFIGAWSRMGIAERKGALAQLAEMLPAGFTLNDGGSL